MELHYVKTTKPFSCEKCYNFKFSGYHNRDPLYGCNLLGKPEYDINDGECPLSYLDYKSINWKIGYISIDKYHARDLKDDCPTKNYLKGESSGSCWGDGHSKCKECSNYRADFKRGGVEYIDTIHSLQAGIQIKLM